MTLPPLMAHAPDDMYWAIGFGVQVVQIHPATDTVVVRAGQPTSVGDSEVEMVERLPQLITEAPLRALSPRDCGDQLVQGDLH